MKLDTHSLTAALDQ